MNYTAEKFLHYEMLRRVGKAGKTRGSTQICSKCKIHTKMHTIEVVHNGKKIRQQYKFSDCADVGPSFSVRSPTKPTKAPVDRRIKRDWCVVKEIVTTTPTNSDQGREARNQIFAQFGERTIPVRHGETADIETTWESKISMEF